MSGMFRIALELSIPKIGLNILLSLPVQKLDAFKLDGVAESDNTASTAFINESWVFPSDSGLRLFHSNFNLGFFPAQSFSQFNFKTRHEYEEGLSWQENVRSTLDNEMM